MGRLRSLLATSEIDRDLHDNIANAEKALGKAADVCRRAATSGLVESKRSREVLRILLGATKVLEGIGHLSAATLPDDTDLLPDDVLAERHRERREAKRKVADAPK